MTICALSISTGTIRRKRPHMTPRYTIQGRPRARTRTREVPRHTTEVHLLGHHGVEPHLGQKPKLGGGTPTSHSSTYHVLSVLCISMFRFLFGFCFRFPKTQKYQKYFLCFSLFVSLFLALVCLKEKSKKILLCLFLLCVVALKNRKRQKYLFFFFGFVKFFAGFRSPQWILVSCY